MRLLFDLISTQFFIGGGSEYIRTVFYGLKDYSDSHEEFEIICLYDSKKGFPYEDLSISAMNARDVICVDINDYLSIRSIIVNYKIDIVFIGVAQFWKKIDVENIECKVCCIIHDMVDEEFNREHLWDYFLLDNFYRFLRHKLYELRHKKQKVDFMYKYGDLYKKGNTKIITVSKYSQCSISYNLGIPTSDILILYSPERLFVTNEKITDATLRSLIEKKKKYYLILSANRPSKNAFKAISAFKRFLKDKEHDAYLVSLGGIEKQFDNHINLSYLSDNDLTQALINCHAFIYPSYFEGFGYPPVEAMKFGKPVISAYDTSMPEILGEAPIYFCPLYETAIYNALSEFVNLDYEEICTASRNRYEEISKRQAKDFDKLIDILTNQTRWIETTI